MYLFTALAGAVMVLIGFGPTYFLKARFHTPALPTLVHVHGALMTAWVLLFLMQATLVATHRIQWHRRLGTVGAFLAVAIVVIGTVTAIRAGRLGHTGGPPSLMFMGFLLSLLLFFAIFVSLALLWRRRPAAHRRLMLLAAISLLGAAVVRIPFAKVPGLGFLGSGGPGGFFTLDNLLLYGCILRDTWRHRRLHPVLGFGAVALLLNEKLIWIFLATPTWNRMATWLIGR